MLKSRTLVIGAVFVVVSGTLALAALLGVTPLLPTTTFSNPSQLSYTASTGAFTVASTPTSTKFNWSPSPVVRLFDTTKPRSLSIAITVLNDGTLSGGTAGDDLVLRGSVTGPDGVVYDGTGATPLLTGEVEELGYQDSFSDLFDFRFRVTGGLLAPFYAGSDLGVTVQSDNGNTFTGTFLSNFGGNAKGTLGPIHPRQIPCTGSIGDFVWNDLNRNGIQDVNEPGINGVQMTLTPTNPAGAVQTTTANSPTGQAGYYQYAHLCAGDYTVTANTPDGMFPTTSNVGASGTDSNGSPANVTLPLNNSTDQTIDFGFQTPCSGTIGDFVWSDTNGDGVQDEGETGVNGVIVQLLDGGGTLITSTATSNHPSTGQPGYYSFGGLCGGSYQVRVLKPASFDHLSPADQGDDATDSDGNPVTGIALVTLANDATDLTIDFGLVPPAPCTGSIGDFVWNDVNGNGIQEPGEQGLNGVLVELKDGSGVLQSTNTTTYNGQAGYYKFTGLSCSASYQVWVTRPAAYSQFSPTTQGSDVTIDSNGQPTQQNTYSVAAVTLTPQVSSDLTIDFGFYACSGSIGDYVWKDLNGNGIQDGGEPGIPNVTLLLQDGQGQSLGITAQTDASGFYQFTGLCAGDYKVVVLSGVPSNLEPTTSGVGSDRAIDSNGSPASVTLNTDFASDSTIDFGYEPIPPATLGDFVWEDLNHNGVQDNGEPGIGNVTVSLYACGSGSPIATTTTNASGFYQFASLAPGSYSVGFTAPSGYVFTTPDQGADAADSDASANGQTPCVTLAAGETNDTVDGGLYRPAAIGDFVWSDLNANGQQGSGEPGIASVVVQLFSCGAASSLDSTQTGGDGSYLFTGLTPGCYTIRFGSVSGYVRTVANSGNDATDSDADSAGNTGNYILVSGETNRTVDAGFYRTASLGDFVWEDLNHNGIQDNGEPGMSGVTVALYSCGGNAPLATTTTNASGLYQFTQLTPGSYFVRVSAPSGYLITTRDQGANDAVDSDVDATGQTSCVTLAAGETNTTVDAGLYRPAAIGDFVWSDTNANGRQDSGEPGLVNVVVQLLTCGSATPLTSTLSSATGGYLFTGLVPGCYVVHFGTASGYLRTASHVVTDTIDSDADANGNTPQYTLASGETNRTVDAGFIQPASICGFVYVDVNNDGIKGSSEAGISGVTITLTGTDTAGNPVSLTTTTSSTGQYCFLGLRPGTYTVRETQPTAYLDGLDTQGTPGTGITGNDVFTSIVLGAGVNGNNNNFGELKKAAYTTFTMGGWGAPPNGGNPGTLLMLNFSKLYPSGVLIGGKKTLLFTNQPAITAFLPYGGTPGVLTSSRVNPLITEAGVFAGQVLSLKLNYDFSVAGLIPKNLGSLRVAPGNPLAGYTVAQVLSLANSVLGGGSLPSGISISTLNFVVTSINGNYDNGTQDNGFLVP